MGDWGIVLIAFGAAVGGGAVTAWFSRPVRSREHPEPVSAPAVPVAEMVALLAEHNRAEAAYVARRESYIQFCDWLVDTENASRSGASVLAGIALVGPAKVERAAQRVVDAVRSRAEASDLQQATDAWFAAARAALSPEAHTPNAP